MNHPSRESADPAVIRALAGYYRKHLIEDVVRFWEGRAADGEYGGYVTCFNRQGAVTGWDKYVWLQGRQLWMFSALFNQVEKRPEWLVLAKQGRDFIARQAYAGNGRWNYHLDRADAVKEGTIEVPPVFWTGG